MVHILAAYVEARVNDIDSNVIEFCQQNAVEFTKLLAKEDVTRMISLTGSMLACCVIGQWYTDRWSMGYYVDSYYREVRLHCAVSP